MHGVLYFSLLPHLPFQPSCCLILWLFLTILAPSCKQDSHHSLPNGILLSTLCNMTHPLQLYRTSPHITAVDSYWQGRTQAATFNECTRRDYAFLQLSCFKTCSSEVKHFWQSRTWCLSMNLNGLHLLHSSVYSEHDFIHDLLIKQITVNSFPKTPLPLYQLTFYKLTWLI